MGKSKGGGGGSTPHIQIPSAISGPNSLGTNVFNPLGTFGSEQMMGLGGLANWAANLATGGNVQTGGTLPASGWFAGGGTPTFAPFTSTGATGGGGAPGTGGPGGSFLSGLNSQQLGPFLANAVQNLINAQGETGNLQTPANTLLTQGGNELASGNKMLTQATTGSGLFPSQQAMINQAVQTQQTDIGQQLAKEGLGNSTLLASLKGQAELSGAATAGQLVQGNIQLAQTEQQLGTGATEAGAQIESQMYQQFASIASMSATMQQNLWNQAIQGYGQLGNFLNGTLASFGYTLQTQEDVLKANEAAAGYQINQEQLQAQAAQAQSQGFTNMLGSLGSLLGTSQSGGLLGGLGSILGGGGGISAASAGLAGGDIGTLSGALASAAGGTGAAAGGAGLLGGLGGAISGIGGAASGAISAVGSALGALFCEVARTVYGVDSPDWLLFRDWILFKAPKSLRTLYVIYAFRISRWIKGRPIICRLIRAAMNAVLYVDKITSKRA